uniref:Major sperm protein n=1 Tax=Caenorhabditis tropicalis TaxID=1561998 RepID=A0A1I7TQH3_9PELO
MMSMLWKASKFNGNDPADLLIGDRRKLTIETIGIIVFSMFVIVITWNGIKTAENHYIILMAIILTVVLTSGEGTRFGIEYNILIFIPLLSVPLVYKVLITYSNLPKSATNITVLSIQTIIYCLIDICLIWRSNLKPLKLWMNLTKEIKNPLTVNPSNSLVRATGGTSTHTLFNEGTKRIIYKIKSSNNKDYRITPVFGFINPSEKRN